MNQLLLLTIVPLWIVVLINVLLTIALIRKFNALPNMDFPTIEPLRVGEKAPEFNVVTTKGDVVTQASYTGEDVAFVFVSPHCEPCHTVLPVIESLRTHAQQVQIELVFVSDSTLAEAEAFAVEHNLTLPILAASQMENPFYNDYKVGGTPFYCFVRDGKVVGADFLSPDCQNLVAHWPPLRNENGAKLKLQPA